MTYISDAQLAKFMKFQEENKEPITITVKASSIRSISPNYGIKFNDTEDTPSGKKFRSIYFIDNAVKDGDKVIITMPKSSYLECKKWINDYLYK